MSAGEVVRAEVFVVDLALDARQIDRCAAVLDPQEHARAARFLRPADRERFVTSHAALRLVLGNTLGRPPDGIRFALGPAGKPELTDAAPDIFDFNLSHSGGSALIGLVRGARIGVDVEAIRPLPDALRIAQGQFAPDEAAALASRPAAGIEAAFFGLWTRKEAVVKALGAGLSLPLARFSVTVPPLPPRVVRIDGDARGWTLAAIDAGAGTAATVAVTAPAAEIVVRRLPADWPAALRADP